MNRIVTVALHEFYETIRTRAFFISVFVVPGLVMFFVFGTERIMKLAQREAAPTRHIALVDETGVLADPLSEQIAAFNAENPKRPFALESVPQPANLASLADRVRSGQLYGYLVVPAGVLDPNATASCQLARKDQQLQAGRDLDKIINAAVKQARLTSAGLDPAELARLQTPVTVEKFDVRTGELGKDDELVRTLTPFCFLLLLFMGTMQISYGLLTSLLEEKSSRVIEVLLAAVKPTELMAGKIIGVVVVGTLLLGIWGGVGWKVAEAHGYGYLVSGRMLAYVAMYFIPGFLLLAAILGAVGSACNTLKEAQSMASPLTILTVVPMMLWLPISQSPNSAFALILSYIPPISPFVMVLRVSSDLDIPWWQLVTTQAVLWAAVIATIWAAGKIFRIGVLMYGKPPSPRELLRWVRCA
jgi:ABC-2 type transport system permease protein